MLVVGGGMKSWYMMGDPIDWWYGPAVVLLAMLV